MIYETKAKHDYWGTPQDLFDLWDKEFHFNLDPCGDGRRLLKLDMEWISEKGDGLSKSWEEYSVFCNPPYSKGQMWDWVKKAFEEKDRAKLIVLLIPVRTDRKAFHKYILNRCEMRFLKGRIGFIDLEIGKQMPGCKHASMLCIWR